jgi:adenylate cyclase
MAEVRGAAGSKGSPVDHGLLAKVEAAAADADGLAAEVLSLGEEEGRAALAGLIRSFREKSALLEVSEALGSQLGLVPLIEKILERASRLLHADRASVFLLDREKGELWSKVAQGMETAEIRFPMDRGISGHVARSGQTLNIEDAYQHPLFNREIDQQTGYRTRTILATPIRNKRDEIIGVVSVINRKQGTFTAADQRAIQNLASILAIALENSMLYEQVLARQQEVSTLLEVGRSLSETLDLASLIEIILEKASGIMGAERSSLFLIDRDTQELWSQVAQGTEEIRFPMTQGIAGQVASTGETLNIKDAYAHPLFNPEIDLKTGYKTRSILCMPIRNAVGETIGVTQMINKRSGAFTAADEHMLAAISAQAGVAIDNAQVYERVRGMKAYLESILQSLSNGVITVDGKGQIASVNLTAGRILGAQAGASVEEGDSIGRPAAEVLGRASGDLPPLMAHVQETGQASIRYDLECKTAAGKDVTLNANAVPLLDRGGQKQGVVVVLEDITREKRVKSSLSRYMSKEIAEQLLAAEGAFALGGVRQEVSVLFSDIRSYTSLTEKADAGQIVAMLNEYFTYMVDVVFEYGGVLDKFIGDAIMAVFGAPFAKPEQDPLNAVGAALEMQRQLAVFNQVRRTRGEKPIDVGIGISTGEAVCGNIGSLKRMDYTAIGDGVNLASRLESATKQYGAKVMVSEFTKAKLKGRFLTRELDWIRVKGKQLPVRIYEVLAGADQALSEETRRLLDLHGLGMELYRKRLWKEALAAFGAAGQAFSKDLTFELYGRRCQYFIEHPPAADWDGVWELKEK